MPKFLVDSLSLELLNFKKRKKNIKGHPILYILVTFVCILSIDMIYRYVNYDLFIDPSYIHMLVFDLTWSLIIVSVLLLLPEMFRKVLLFIIILVFIVAGFAQSVSSILMGGVMSSSVLVDAPEGTVFTRLVLGTLTADLFYYIIPFALISSSMFFRMRLSAPVKKTMIIFGLTIVSIVGTGFYTSRDIFNNQVESTDNLEKFIYLEEHDVVATRLGITTYTLKDIYNNLLGLNSNLYNLENDKSNLLGQLEGYLSQTVHNTSDYTGVFKDKNLILIQVESLDHIAVNPEVMPTLANLKATGMNFKNFISPLYMRTTSDIEFAVQTGIPPSGLNTNSISDCGGNVYPNAIVNLFNDTRYTTASFHNYDDSIYPRNEFYDNLGSD